jgi:hypothetical protein
MTRLSSVAALVVVLLAGCNLEVENPNAPDARRAFNDPSGLEQLLAGGLREWTITRGDYFGPLTMTAMADSYTASWNNTALRFYSSVGVECPARCGWTNSATAPEAEGAPSVEGQWYGYYTVLSSATDVLRAVRDGLCFDTNCATDNTLTSRNTTIAKMLQGMALAGIAMVYDQGFIVDEDTDLASVGSIPFSTRQEVRDAAIQKFEDAYAEAGLKSWSTPAEWHGVGAGRSYTSTQIRQLIRTMQAELLAMWPRNAAENAQVNWAQVATYASQGISSGTSFDWEFYIDANSHTGATDTQIDFVKLWGNALFTMRVDTRVAAMITTNHQHPWPEAQGGNPCPTTSPDRRVGDGSYGPEDDFSGGATTAETANAGTDFACSGVPIFPAARGQYHQSNLQHIRYERLTYQGEGLPGSDGTGQDPFYTVQMNDLLWAEGLIRSGGNPVLAAQLINNSRVGRGGLLPAVGGTAELLAALQYEQEIEFMGQGATPFFNRRRIDGLQTATPRHMPVPAKELDVLVREIYTFGGPGRPDMALVAGDGQRVRSVREIWAGFANLRRTLSSRKN